MKLPILGRLLRSHTTNLKVIQLVWFTQICRVAYRVVAGEGAEDTRSDDEE